MVRGFERLAILPLHIVHDVTAVLAAVKACRHEAGLGCHEAGTLRHQIQHLGLIVRGDLDGGDLGDDAAVLAYLRHGALLLLGAQDNANRMRRVARRRTEDGRQRTDEIVHVPAMCDHRGPLIPSFRHPEALAPPQISLRNLRTLDCVARASKGDGLGRSSFEGRARARPPQDDGIWIELTGTRFGPLFPKFESYTVSELVLSGL